MLRTHTCGELRSEHIGQRVTLCGWIDTSRDHGGTMFIDLRDRYGKTQCVANADSGEVSLEVAKKLRGEDVALISGIVSHRLEGKINAKLATGEIEIRADEVRLLKPLPNASVLPESRRTAGGRSAIEVSLYRFAA